MLTTFLALGLMLAPQQTFDPEVVHGKLRERLKSAKSLTYEVETFVIQGGSTKPHEKAKAMALRPNLLAVETTNQCWFCNGSKSYEFFKKANAYREVSMDPAGMWLPLGQGLYDFSPVSAYKPNFVRAVRSTFEGRSVISLEEEPKAFPGLTNRILIDEQSWLPLGWEQVTADSTFRGVYKSLQTDRDLDLALFAWSPPKGANDAAKVPVKDTSLAPGAEAPMFSFSGPKGETVDMKSLLKGKKALLVSFWFYNCGYCQLEMPHLRDLYGSAHAKGLEILLINTGADSTKLINDFISRARLTMPIATMGQQAATAYGVQGCPMNYLITPDGKISYRLVGFGDEGAAALAAAIKKLGIE